VALDATFIKETRLEAIWFDEFFAEGLITDVVSQLKSGKEATVFICRAGADSHARPLAVKYFRPRLGRGFQNRAAYQHGRAIPNARTSRAVANKSRFGQQVEESLWVNHEFDMLCRLHFAGADVPQPLAAAGSAILMEFVGDEDGPAPQLRELRLTPEEARRILDRLLWNIERLLASNVIHADLSAYNILIHDGSPRIIDLPQAVDPRTNCHAEALLARDIDRVCRYFERFGIHSDATGLSADLWQRYQRAEL
jgi:RIO kinase 1